MRWIKYFAWTFGAIVALLLLAAGALIALNGFDEPLEPQVAAAVERAHAAPFIVEGNAYLFIRGLTAPAGEEVERFGLARYEGDQRRSKHDEPEHETPGLLKFAGDSLYLCLGAMPDNDDGSVCPHQAQTQQMLRDNRELLARYYRLLDLRIYQEPAAGPSFPEPDLIALMRLAHVDMEHMLEQGELDRAAGLLSRNLAFWRSALSGKYGMISGALLRVGYSFSVSCLADFIRRWPKLLSRADFDAELAREIGPDREGLRGQMERELMQVDRAYDGADLLWYPGLQHPPLLLKWGANRLYRRNATLNSYRHCLERFYSVRELTGEAFEKAASAYRDFEVDDALHFAINPTGKAALYLHLCPKQRWLDEFATEPLEAKRRLVRLEIRLLKSGRVPARYPELLSNADAELRDPRTDLPARWDAQRKVIFFARKEGCYTDGPWLNLGALPGKRDCRS